MRSSKQLVKPKSALILADIEGIIGVYDKKQCTPNTSEWQAARNLITADVNSAVKGLKEAGVSEIYVKDMHGTGFNLIPEKIEKGARCSQGHFWKPVPLLGKIPKVNYAVMIGWHAGPDQHEGFSPHIFHKAVRQVKINGSPVTEVELFSSVLGEYNIPVIFVSADHTALSRIKSNMPWIASLEIPKHILSPEECLSLHDQIRKTVRQAAVNSEKFRPFLLGPHWVEMKGIDKTEVWESPGAVETFRTILIKSVFRKFPVPFLPLLLSSYRLWCRIMN
jgi:D-amino peptidase